MAGAGNRPVQAGVGERWYGTIGPVAVITDPADPTPVGTSDPEIPDGVHRLAAGYLGSSRFATTWFRIGHRGGRSLHPGRVSAGCTTVPAVNAWTAVYDYRIVRRTGDGVSVGTITITDG